MDTDFLRQALRSKRELFVRFHQFSDQPGRYIHAEHLREEWNPGLLSRLRSSARGRRKLTDWVRSRWALEAVDFREFETEAQRVALLDCAVLERLTSLTGAALYGRRIALVVDRATQTRMKEALGEDYLFALKRAPFLVKHLPDRLAEPLGEDTAGQLQEAGRICLMSCVADCSQGVLDRLALKLPPGFRVNRETALSDTERRDLWKPMKRILLSEVDPTLASCFD